MRRAAIPLPGLKPRNSLAVPSVGHGATDIYIRESAQKKANWG